MEPLGRPLWPMLRSDWTTLSNPDQPIDASDSSLCISPHLV